MVRDTACTAFGCPLTLGVLTQPRQCCHRRASSCGMNMPQENRSLTAGDPPFSQLLEKTQVLLDIWDAAHPGGAAA